ncbi:MAG: hypothetical protein K0U19_03590 [Proteobacteria bacterium]|nr:hypothetical protein [Pseudomonadota bacterium]
MKFFILFCGILLLCGASYFFEIIHFNEKIEGFQDLKFGMTEKQVKSTEIYKNGVLLFGEKRRIIPVYDLEGRVFQFEIIMGKHDDKIQNKLIKLLDDKYRLSKQPSFRSVVNQQIVKNVEIFNSHSAKIKYENERALSWDAFEKYESELSWDFAEGQVSFVKTKEADKNHLIRYTNDKEVYLAKTTMHLVYRDRDVVYTKEDSTVTTEDDL